MNNDHLIAGDLIFGAEAIADFLGMQKRQVYHAAAMDYLPVFRIGSSLACRKSTLTRWIVEREERSLALRRGLGPS